MMSWSYNCKEVVKYLAKLAGMHNIVGIIGFSGNVENVLAAELLSCLLACTV